MKVFNSLEEVVFCSDSGRRSLGTGSFASVKLVHHRDDNTKLYAMKTVEKRSPKAIQLISKEIKLHITLSHPHIIGFVDYLDFPKKVYIFLEYASNGDLFGYVNKRKLSEDQCLRFFYQTCEGICYIHCKNIMHRDLKPENILVDGELNIKVADFGWSAEYFPEESRQTLCGTYEYMAPEIFAKKSQTKKTDVWALGVLLYELFHGHAPFRGTKLDEVLSNITKNVIVFRKSINPSIKALILKILCYEPSQRPTVEEILQSDVMVDFITRHPQYKVRLAPEAYACRSESSSTRSRVDLVAGDEISSPYKTTPKSQTNVDHFKTEEKPKRILSIAEITKSLSKVILDAKKSKEEITEKRSEPFMKEKVLPGAETNRRSVDKNPKGLFTPVTGSDKKQQPVLQPFLLGSSGDVGAPKTFSNYLKKYL